MRIELLPYDEHVVKTNKVFRDVGYTMSAMKYKLSAKEVAWLCKFNNTPANWKPPIGWHYAPNKAVKEMLEWKAYET